MKDANRLAQKYKDSHRQKQTNKSTATNRETETKQTQARNKMNKEKYKKGNRLTYKRRQTVAMMDCVHTSSKKYTLCIAKTNTKVHFSKRRFQRDGRLL